MHRTLAVSRHLRWIAASLLGLAGFALGSTAPDPWVALAWLAVAAPAAGHLAGAGSVRTRCLPCVAWLVAFALAALLGGFHAQAWAALAVLGLYCLGLATGRATGASWTGAALWSAVGLVLGAAPMGWGVLASPWPPEVAARLLDASPLSLVLESAGADWMRHPAVYEPAGTLDIGPQMRQAWRGTLAGPGLCVVGWIALLASVVFVPRAPSPRTATTMEDS